MTRKNIFELLKEKYNIEHEMNKITTLFYSQMFKYIDSYTYKQTIYKIENIVDNRLLFAWKQRNSCLSCNEIKAKLNLEHEYSRLDNVILILEYYENLIYLVPKNPSATAVAEISDEETAMAILMYNHRTLKGDLEAKRKILYSIAKEYEPLLSKPIDGFKDYFVKATNMLNNLDIRHNNKKGKHKNNLVVNLKNDELEKWYDELYQLLLFCVLIKDNIERKNNIEEFLKNLKQGA